MSQGRRVRETFLWAPGRGEAGAIRREAQAGHWPCVALERFNQITGMRQRLWRWYRY